MIERVFVLIYGPALATRFLDTFRDFPPRQKAASFTIDQVIESLNAFLPKTDGAVRHRTVATMTVEAADGSWS